LSGQMQAENKMRMKEFIYLMRSIFTFCATIAFTIGW